MASERSKCVINFPKHSFPLPKNIPCVFLCLIMETFPRSETSAETQKLSRCSEHIPRWPARRLFQYWHNMICWKGCGSRGESKLNNWERQKTRTGGGICMKLVPKKRSRKMFRLNFRSLTLPTRTFIAWITTLIARSERKSIGKTNLVALFAFSDEFFSSAASTFSVILTRNRYAQSATGPGHLTFLFSE